VYRLGIGKGADETHDGEERLIEGKDGKVQVWDGGRMGHGMGTSAVKGMGKYKLLNGCVKTWKSVMFRRHV